MAYIEPSIKSLKTGQQVQFRTAIRWDARALARFKTDMLATSSHLNSEYDEARYSASKERRAIARTLHAHNEVILLAVHNKKIIGTIETMTDRRRRLAHSTLVGLSIAQEFRNQGLGRLLLEEVLSWARAHDELERVQLFVHSNNIHAIALYKSLGFIEEGRRKNGIKINDNEYVDDILMCAYLDPKREQQNEEKI